MTRGFRCGVLMVMVGSAGVMVAAPVSGPPPGQHGSVARGAQGYFGIDVRDIGDDEIAALKLKDSRGAEIIRVDHDGPAGKMGLREHDVVVQLNGALIEGEDQIRRLLHEIAPGRTVSLVISRAGQMMSLIAQMADRIEVERQAWELHLATPAPQAPATGLPSEEVGQGGGQVTAGPPPTAKYSKSFLGTILMTPAYTGVMLEGIGPQLSQFFGVPKGTGLLVKSVDNNSPAAMAGIRAGDVVVRANSKAIANMTDWARTIRDAKGSPVAVVVLRDHGEKTLSLTPEAKKRSELELPQPWDRPARTMQAARLTEL